MTDNMSTALVYMSTVCPEWRWERIVRGVGAMCSAEALTVHDHILNQASNADDSLCVGQELTVFF